MSITNQGIVTRLAGTDILADRRLVLSSNTWIYAGLGVDHDGISLNTVASGNAVACALQSLPDVFRLSMATTFAAGDLIYGAASGQGSTTKSGNPIGKALNASTSTGGVAEVIPLAPEASKRAFECIGTASSATITVPHGLGAAPSPAIAHVQVYTSAGAPRALTSVVVDATNVVVVVASGASGDFYYIRAILSSDP